MDSLYNQSDFSDVTLILIDQSTHEKKSIHAHKAILANCSEYFRGLFSSKFKEGLQHTIEIEVPTVDLAIKLIQHLYSKHVLPVKFRELADMWLISSVGNEKIKYPGPSANFVYGEGRWDERSSVVYKLWYGNPIRNITYRSITPNSAVYRFTIYESETTYKERRCKIYINKNRCVNIHDYLIQYGVDTVAYSQYETYSEYETRTIIELLIRNNFFEDRDIQQINEIFDNMLYI